MSIKLLRVLQQLLLTVDLTFNHTPIETEDGKSIKIALPVENNSTRGKRVEISPIDDWCPIDMNKEEFERIIDEFIKIPLN